VVDQVFAGEDPAEGVDEGIAIDVLRDEGACPGADRVEQALIIDVHREEDQLRVLMLLAQHPRDLQAGHARELDVEQDQFGVVDIGEVDCLVSVLRFPDDLEPPGVLEHPAQPTPEHGVVFDQQHPPLEHRFSSSAFPCPNRDARTAPERNRTGSPLPQSECPTRPGNWSRSSEEDDTEGMGPLV